MAHTSVPLVSNICPHSFEWFTLATPLTSRNRMEEIKMYIDANFKNPMPSVTFLADRANLSEVYFRKLFRAQFDISPAQYIISVRLKKAKELMKSPFLTLEECALQSGFSSLQYFCRVFKKATGITPGSYRSKK